MKITLVEKHKDFIMEVIHFGMVGVINTLMGWGIMALLYNLIHMNYWLSSGISYFLGSVFSYHANAKLTFKVEERDKRLPWRFAFNIIVCYLISFSVAKPLTGRLLAVIGLGADGRISQALLENIAMICGMGIFIVMNFFGQKLFVFRNRKSHGGERKWFRWITKYWFLAPVVAFPLFAAAVFFGYGERSYIGVHDNMDLFLAQFQMLKNTGSFFKHGVDVPFLGGVTRDDLPSEFSLYSLLYMLFPTYTAYILGIIGKILMGMFSFRLLAAELFPARYRVIRPIVYMTGLCYGALWFFPAFGFAFASIPLCVFLLLKIYRRKEKRWGLWYAALLAYPLVSYFSYHGIFILGYLALAVLWLIGRRICAGRAGADGSGDALREQGKAVLRMAAALFVLAAGYVLCEYRLFGQMLFSDEVTIRSSIVNASLTPAEIAAEIVQVFREGIFHADSVHGKVVLPVCALYFVINNAYYIIKREWKRIPRDPFNLLMTFILFNCAVYGLYDFEPLRSLVERLIPQLEGWQFNRTIFFNPLLWYGALFLVLLRLYEGGLLRVWLANAIVCLALLAVILTPNRYNDLYNTCYNRVYEFYHGAEVDELSYGQFYAVDLFDEIKADIGYQGEWAAAYGFHPAVLEYNGIATLDGYLGFYPQSYKEAFRKVIAPALARVEETRVYYDDWGARAYLYSGTDLSIVQAAKTVYATDDRIYIDGEAFRGLGGEYLFSRIRLSNAGECGLSLIGEYTAADGSMTIFVYQCQ